MTSTSPAIGWRARLGWNRSSSFLLGMFFTTIVVIGIVWWPLLADYVGSYDPRFPWWAQTDWLLLGVFAFMTLAIVSRADLRRDLRTVGVGLAGGLVIESWGTQTGLWTYYTFERPPLWILPAWPVASLAIDRLTSRLQPLFDRLPRGAMLAVYAVVFAGFLALMLAFVWPTIDRSLTMSALALCAFLIAVPRQPATALATFAAGSGLGYFLELWGTTRACWTYYTLETPPMFSVLAHGMAAVAFWRSAEAISSVARRIARSAGRIRRRSSEARQGPALTAPDEANL